MKNESEYIMNFYNLNYSSNEWTTISTGEMAMIVYPRVVRSERFLADVTMYRITVRFPFFRQHFHGHVSGYDIFNMIRQVLELSREPRINLHRDGTDTTITRHHINNARSSPHYISRAVDMCTTTHLSSTVLFSVKRTPSR